MEVKTPFEVRYRPEGHQKKRWVLGGSFESYNEALGVAMRLGVENVGVAVIETRPQIVFEIGEEMKGEQENFTCKWAPGSCSKHKYRNRAIAERKLAELRAAGRREVAVYKCPVCLRFHLTSRDDWRERDECGRDSG